MAGILVGDPDWKRFQFCSEAESGEEFGDVASLGGGDIVGFAAKER